MSPFFVNYEDGRVATRQQLEEAGIVPVGSQEAPRPWHRIRGSIDASTLWYAVMVKRVRGVFIATLCIRHGGRRPLLEADGWREVPVDRIGVGAADRGRAEPYPM